MTDADTSGPVQRAIESKLQAALAPSQLDVVNESHMHNVPPGSESHFKVVAVSAQFDGQGLVQRHRAVNRAVADELSSTVHALALHLFTPAEWAERSGGAGDSPQCLGGGKS